MLTSWPDPPPTSPPRPPATTRRSASAPSAPSGSSPTAWRPSRSATPGGAGGRGSRSPTPSASPGRPSTRSTLAAGRTTEVFERFTQEARRVVVGAQVEARELRAEKIEPVHLLLALTQDDGRGGAALRACGVDHASARSAVTRAGSPLDADALAAFGIDLDQVRAAAEAAFGPGALDPSRPEPSGHIPFADG